LKIDADINGFLRKNVHFFCEDQKCSSIFCEYYFFHLPLQCKLRFDMIVRFEKEYLQELYETGQTTDKKHRFQPQIARKYIYCIKALESATCIESLYQVKSFHYEVLKGDREGISSIRVNLQYRIEFTVVNEGIEPVITVCNIIELSNHYK